MDRREIRFVEKVKIEIEKKKFEKTENAMMMMKMQENVRHKKENVSARWTIDTR